MTLNEAGGTIWAGDGPGKCGGSNRRFQMSLLQRQAGTWDPLAAALAPGQMSPPATKCKETTRA